jgi:hypothetical protein
MRPGHAPTQAFDWNWRNSKLGFDAMMFTMMRWTLTASPTQVRDETQELKKKLSDAGGG